MKRLPPQLLLAFGLLLCLASLAIYGRCVVMLNRRIDLTYELLTARIDVLSANETNNVTIFVDGSGGTEGPVDVGFGTISNDLAWVATNNSSPDVYEIVLPPKRLEHQETPFRIYDSTAGDTLIKVYPMGESGNGFTTWVSSRALPIDIDGLYRIHGLVTNYSSQTGSELIYLRFSTAVETNDFFIPRIHRTSTR